MPEIFEIEGGQKLSGEIEVNGAKNSALKILAASLLSDEKCKITNFPFIEDTKRIMEIMEELGVRVEKNEELKEVEIDPSGIKGTSLTGELVRKLRASILLAGPLLARFGEVEIDHPGGCVIGKRPIDFFVDGFKKLGASCEENDQSVKIVSGNNGLVGEEIIFPKISVTGTESLMMTAVLAKGKTILKNCAMEPEIPVLVEYLNKCGAKISGAGTSTIIIDGVGKISGGEFEVIPDRIETGTFLMMGLVTDSEITIKKCIPEHLGSVLEILKGAGAKFEIGTDYIRTISGSKLEATSIATHEYPGFATDLQPPYTLLMTQAKGMCMVHETIFDGRLFFVDQLSTMGANIVICDPHRVIVIGPAKLFGKKLSSPDLRAGITMLIAGMIAEGKTIIENIYQIDRGYEKIEERLAKIGAKIKRVRN